MRYVERGISCVLDSHTDARAHTPMQADPRGPIINALDEHKHAHTHV